MKRAEVVALIKKNGGVFASSVTKAVTHIIVADPSDTTAKIVKARETGVKIVGIDFLDNFM